MTRFIFILLCALTFSVAAFGQDLNTDLGKSFNKFSLVKMNNQEALQKAKLRQAFKIQTNEKTFQFILRLNDIRSKDYKAEYTDRNGRHSLPKGEAFTYKATLIGEKNSMVALTVDGTKIEGYLATETEGFFIESAKKYSTHANDEDKVIFQVKDKVDKDDGICGLDEAVAAEMKNVSSKPEFNTAPESQTGRKVLEVATEADKEFVQDSRGGNGSPTTANADILSVMNQVDIVFERQLNLSVVITFQHAWMPGAVDPYAGFTNNDNLLNLFANYWNANFPRADPTYRRDIGHLFTAKITNNPFPIGGLAIAIGTVCISSGGISYSYTSTLRFDKWLIVAHELGHNLGAFHTDQDPVQPSCAGTIMSGNLYPSIPEFCPYSVNQITNYINASGSCLDLEPNTSSTTTFDFDADGEADVSLFRPSNNFWYIQQSSAGFYSFLFGLSTDKLSPADYDGDGKTDIAVFRNGTWYLQRSRDGFLAVTLGTSGDIPVPADFTGDDRAELAVFRPSTGVWLTLNLTNNQTNVVSFGLSGDKPVPADYDGDGKIDYAVFRPSDTTWYLQQSTQGFAAVQFGLSTDKPVPADYDGDDKADVAVFRDGTWYLLRSSQGFTAISFGLAADLPTPADYDGDGKADISVFRDGNGTWYRINSSTDVVIYITFGLSGDIPIPAFKIVQ